MTTPAKLFELYLETYARARCGGDASGAFAVYEYRALPYSAVIVVAAHDGASGSPPRAWQEVHVDVARVIGDQMETAEPPAAG